MEFPSNSRPGFRLAGAALLGTMLLSACGPEPGDPADGGADTGASGTAGSPGGSSGTAGASGLASGGATLDAGEDSSGGAEPDAEVVVEDAGSDALADSDADAEDDTDAAVVPGCGNGVRELGEECDDGVAGPDDPSRGCTSSCVVKDRLVATAPADERWLGAGRHPVSCGPAGGAVAFLESNSGDVRVAVSVFDQWGVLKGTAHLPIGLGDSDPVIASLPFGGQVVAFADHQGASGLDISLVRIAPDGQLTGAAVTANDTTGLGQHSPDIVWTGQDLLVAWLDDSPSALPSASGRRICTRRFDPALNPLGGEDCGQERPFTPGHPALASGAPGIARAWREATELGPAVMVQGPGWSLELAINGEPDALDVPAVAWIDNQSLLVVHSAAEGRLSATVVDLAGVVLHGPTVLNPAPGASRAMPALAVTQSGTFIAWYEPASSPDPDTGWSPLYDELWLQRFAWDGASLQPAETAIPMPREAAHRPGDQTLPALAGCGQLLVASWQDMATNFINESKHGDVAVEWIPTPILRGTLP